MKRILIVFAAFVIFLSSVWIQPIASYATGETPEESTETNSVVQEVEVEPVEPQVEEPVTQSVEPLTEEPAIPAEEVKTTPVPEQQPAVPETEEPAITTEEVQPEKQEEVVVSPPPETSVPVEEIEQPIEQPTEEAEPAVETEAEPEVETEVEVEVEPEVEAEVEEEEEREVTEVRQWTAAELITGINIYDSKGQELVDGSTIVLYERYLIDLQFALPDSEPRVKAGDQLIIPVPWEMGLQKQNDGIPVIDSTTNTQAGLVEIKDNNIVVTFNEYVESKNGIKGFIKIYGEWWKKNTESETPVDINFNLIKNYTFKQDFTGTGQGSLFGKYGEPVSTNEIDWYIDVNYLKNESIDGAYIVDEFVTEALQYKPGSLKVIKREQAVNGNWIGEIPVNESEVLTYKNGKVSGFRLPLGDIDPQFNILVKYTTSALDAGLSHEYTNIATLFGHQTQLESELTTVELFGGSAGIGGKTGSVSITKKNPTGDFLSGATFVLEKKVNDTWVVQKTTESLDGYANFTQLLIGEYRVTETKAPGGYIGDPTPKEFTISQAELDAADTSSHFIKLEFINEPIVTTGAFTLKKVDSKTKEPLAGAVFTLKKGDATYTLTTNSEGVATQEGLEPGEYTLVEIQAPAGYKLEQTPKTITIEKEKTTEIEMTNELNPTIVQLIKVDGTTGAPLAGAEFTLTNGTDSYTLVTGADGKVSQAGLKVGTYTITEIKAPTGYVLNPEAITVEVRQGETTAITLENDLARYSIELEKLDEVSNKPLKDVSFTLYQKQGEEWVVVSPYEAVKTDENGKITFSNLLPGVYKVEEVSALPGYIGEFSQEMTIKGQNINVQVKNTPYANVLITKVDSVDLTALPGAKFQLYKQNEAGEYEIVPNAIYETGADGKVTIEKLELGKYRLVEIMAPVGYYVSTQPVDFEVTKDHLSKPGHVIELQIENTKIPPVTPTTGDFTLTKVDGATKDVLAGAEFTFTNGTTTITLVTDAQGKATATNLAPGEYTLTETKAPVGYTLSTETVKVTVTAGQTATYTFNNTKTPVTPPDQGTEGEDGDNGEENETPPAPPVVETDEGNNPPPTTNKPNVETGKITEKPTVNNNGGKLPQTSAGTIYTTLLGLFMVSMAIYGLRRRKYVK